MLIGPPVLRMAAAAPGITTQGLPRPADPARAWIRARITEIAAGLGLPGQQAAFPARPAGRAGVAS
jgi:hypothetical protein